MQDDKYTLEKELGEGGFGITYLARENNRRKVVIKTLNDTVQRRSDFAKFQQDFLNEALRLAKCSHPHIVRVDEVIQEGALWCMVMEYIDGEDLATRIENQGALPEAEALKYMNYKKLRDLLAAKKWLEADRETAAVILKVSRGGKEGSLKPEHLEKFPSQDLQTIDKLWGKYSNGRFGFSVQKRIWQSVGGTKDSDYSIFRRFAIRVGWLVKEGGLLGWFGDQWVDKEASQLNFANRFSSEKYIPEGYFPCSVLLWCGEGTFSVWPEPGRSLLSRRDL